METDKKQSLPQRAGAIGKAFLVYLGTGSVRRRGHRVPDLRRHGVLTRALYNLPVRPHIV